jgi:hypothetical protein
MSYTGKNWRKTEVSIPNRFLGLTVFKAGPAPGRLAFRVIWQMVSLAGIEPAPIDYESNARTPELQGQNWLQGVESNDRGQAYET